MLNSDKVPLKRSSVSFSGNVEEADELAPGGSPGANLRYISSRRANNERQRLFDRNNDIGDYKTTSLQGIDPVEEIDDESIIYENLLPARCCTQGSGISSGSGIGGGSGNGIGTVRRLVSSPLGDRAISGGSKSGLTNNLEAEKLEVWELLPYYLPILSWIPQYNGSYFMGDLVGGLSLVFFQLPLSLSYATSLAHVPVICGLYSLALSPVVYMILGSVPQMIVGPEAAILMVVGQAVEPFLHHRKKEGLDPIDLVAAITFVSGSTLLGFGLGRFGFLDNVLCYSLLKGFISGVGIVMVINAAIAMLGLSGVLEKVIEDPSKMDIHSPFDKLKFLFENYDKYHSLTLKISMAGFIAILLIQFAKRMASKGKAKHLSKITYIPEILIVVMISTYLCYYYQWHKSGIEIVGKVHSGGSTHTLHNPLAVKRWGLIKSLSTPGFFCAMLGFFESTTALKSLGSSYDLPISSNRELVALGAINIFVSFVGGLPAFGGYGRSKINAISAKSTLLGAIMGVLTILTVAFLLDALYYVPKCTLSVITATIGILLIDEAPYELYFHWKSRGYDELITFFITVTTTLFFSMETGIALGLLYLLVRVIKHSAESRIQILGRIPGTTTFVDADIVTNSYCQPRPSTTQTQMVEGNSLVNAAGRTSYPLNVFTDSNFTHINTQVLEEIEDCLIIRIPEPLTFTNTNDLTTRLKRVELFGSTKAHPALKRCRDASLLKYIIFDLNGMTELDSSAAKILKDLLLGHKNREILSFFVRITKQPKVRLRLKSTGIEDLLARDLDIIRNCYQGVLSSSYTRPPVSFKEPNFLKGPDAIDSAAKIEYSPEREDLVLLSLTEDFNSPYFDHITDALKVIDQYEMKSQMSSNTGYLDVDVADRRSSLPTNELV